MQPLSARVMPTTAIALKRLARARRCTVSALADRLICERLQELGELPPPAEQAERE